MSAMFNMTGDCNTTCIVILFTFYRLTPSPTIRTICMYFFNYLFMPVCVAAIGYAYPTNLTPKCIQASKAKVPPPPIIKSSLTSTIKLLLPFHGQKLNSAYEMLCRFAC